MLTGAGLIDAKVVHVDAANDLALLKANAEGRMKNEETFKPLPIAASRTGLLGGTAATDGIQRVMLLLTAEFPKCRRDRVENPCQSAGLAGQWEFARLSG